MTDETEEKVSEFYNTVGWKTDGEITEDAARWEDLRVCAYDYVRKCRQRVARYIPSNGDAILDMASGPIQYPEYLEYSKGYRKRYCVDLSAQALKAAEEKIGNHGVFLCGSFFDIDFEEDFFDCSVSMHTIYHINKDKQEDAVRRLIAVTKPGRPVIIVYSNPDTLVHALELPVLFLLRIVRRLRKKQKNISKEPELYFFAHPIRWWDRFRDVADVTIRPWRSFSSDVQKVLVPDSAFGQRMFDILFRLEERFPVFFVRHFQYPVIILTKRN